MSLSTFILGELYSGGMAYGREFQRRFEAAGIPSWERVHHASIYRALARLSEAGLVARYRPAPLAGRAPGRRGSPRNRKFFSITARGRRAFESMLSGELAEPRTYRNPLNIAVHCVRVLPQARAVALLEARRRRLAEHEAAADRAARLARAASSGMAGDGAVHARLAAERILMKARAELFFAGSLADYLAGATSPARASGSQGRSAQAPR
jgi:DNA-binding PadR family transcriptional regulator